MTNQRTDDGRPAIRRFWVSYNPDSRTDLDVDPWEVLVLDRRGIPACVASSGSLLVAADLAIRPTPQMVKNAEDYEAPRDYIDPAEVTRIRVFHDGASWNVDGRDGKGGHTEVCYTLDSWAEAVAHVPRFVQTNAPHLTRKV